MRLPKLHIRDLFWLVLVCGLVLGWSLDHCRLSLFEAAHTKSENRRKALVNELKEEGIGVFEGDSGVSLHQLTRVLGKKRMQRLERHLARELDTLPELEISHPR